MVAARPVAEKGHGVFVEALALAGERVRGVMVGPPSEDLATRAREAGLQTRLALEGPRSNVGDYYAALDALVVPSTAEECMPLVILEAASAGTPTFGSRLAGIPEALAGGVSSLFEPGDPAELAELMVAAEHDRRGTASMGRRAFERWRRDFQLDAMVRATLELYGEAVATPTVSETCRSFL
jgi:glycosyltransferase involved in cell wall biosynthesis